MGRFSLSGNGKLFCLTYFLSGNMFFNCQMRHICHSEDGKYNLYNTDNGKPIRQTPEVGLLFRHEHHCPAAVFLVLDLVSSSYPLLNPQDLHVRGNGRDLIPLALTYSFDWDPTSSSPCSDGEHGHKDAMG